MYALCWETCKNEEGRIIEKKTIALLTNCCLTLNVEKKTQPHKTVYSFNNALVASNLSVTQKRANIMCCRVELTIV